MPAINIPNSKRNALGKFRGFLRLLILEIVKNAFFIQKHIFFTKNEIFSLEEHVLIKLRIVIDTIIFFSFFFLSYSASFRWQSYDCCFIPPIVQVHGN